MVTSKQNVAAAARIKRLIRCRRTLRYVKGDGWTSDPNEAQTFDYAIDAARVCIDRGLIDVELVLRAPEAGELISTPIR
jgi:hypothetical protein